MNNESVFYRTGSRMDAELLYIEDLFGTSDASLVQHGVPINIDAFITQELLEGLTCGLAASLGKRVRITVEWP